MADLPAGTIPLLSGSTLRHLATLWSQAQERALVLVGFIALAVLAVVFIGLGFVICWAIFVLPLRRKAAAAEQTARAQPPQPPQRQPWEPPAHAQAPEQVTGPEPTGPEDAARLETQRTDDNE